MAKRASLGRGMAAVFEDNTTKSKDSISKARLTDIEPNKNQPRKKFDDAEIQALADSILEHGVIQPIIVRPLPDERYQIVAGERRWRACKMAGLTEIPIIVRELTDADTAKIALIENIQRSDLNPVEEAAAYKQLIDQFGMTQDEVAKMVGKSRSVIANSVRLLNLPDEIQDMLKNDRLSVGHAKALVGVDDIDFMIEMARKAADGLLTVRNIEKLVSDHEFLSDYQKIDFSEKTRKDNNYYTEMELALADQLKRKVKISVGNDGKGTISIDFFDKNDLEEISNALSIL